MDAQAPLNLISAPLKLIYYIICFLKNILQKIILGACLLEMGQTLMLQAQMDLF